MTKRKFNKERFLNIEYILFSISIFLTLSLLLCFKSRISIFRLLTSSKDLFTSIIYTFVTLFGIKYSINPTVIVYPDYSRFFENQNIINNEIIKPNVNKFENLKYFKEAFLNKEIFNSYLNKYLSFLMVLVQLILIFILIYIIFKFLLDLYLKKKVVNVDKKSYLLKKYLIFKENVLLKIYLNIKYLVVRFLNNRLFLITFISLLSIYFNFLTILIEFVSYYIYLISSLNFGNIYFQLYKFYLDIKIYFKTMPITLHIILFFIIFEKVRKAIGYSILERNERKNTSFIKNSPIALMLIGTMGSKKTTLLTDISLTQTNIFKNNALKELVNIRIKFNKYNFNKLDLFLKENIQNNNIKNLKNVDKHVKEFYLKDDIYLDNKLSIESLNENILNYSKLFLIYYISSSLLITNYSIRENLEIDDIGNFPLIKNEFFKNSSYSTKEDKSVYSHIIDFDMMRYGKKLSLNNNYEYDFGCFTLTEFGKERGNQLTNQGLKKQDEKTNQKNDLFNSFIKLTRHTSTVCNYPYTKILSDEQRSQSLEADIRELFYLITIKDSKKYKNAFKFYFLEKNIYSFILNKYNKFFVNLIYLRSDDNLIYYFLRSFINKIYLRDLKIQNTFGYYVCKLEVENAQKENEKNEVKYYLSKKKIYSNRFSTDCYEKFLTSKKDTGIQDIKKYTSVKAEKDELISQNSYFINDLTKLGEKESE